VQSRNGTNSDSDKDSLDKEFGQLAKEVQRVLAGTTFNNKHIVGSDASTMTFQVGANTTGNDTIDVKFTNMTTATSIVSVAGSADGGVTTSRSSIGSVATTGQIKTVIDDIDAAINKINDERASLGATQSRFDAVISNLQISSENQSAAKSRIMDADFAAETAALSRAQVLQQAGNAMVAQANQLPQQVLSLLKG
jgi:flagellin